MKSPFGKPWTEFAHQCFVISLCLALIFLPLRAHYANIAVGFATGLWVVNFLHNRKFYTPDLRLPLVLFTALYWILVVGMLHTDNVSNGFFDLERKLALLLLPVVILVSPLNKSQLKAIFLSLLIGATAVSVICYYETFRLIQAANLPWFSIFTESRFQNLFFSQHIPIHPAYLSNLLILDVVFLLYWFRDMSMISRVLAVMLSFFFAATIIVLAARASMLGILCMIPAVALYQAVRKRKLTFLTVGGSALIAIVFVLFYALPSLQARLFESVDDFGSMVKSDDQYHSVPLHAKVWHCALDVNCGFEVIFGQGTGDERDRLKDCYLENNWTVIAEHELDSHNEYLSAYVRHGLIGAALWIAALAYGFWLSIKSGNSAYFAFMILISVAAFAESILRGQVSLITYALLNACFVRYSLNEAHVAKPA